MTYKELYDKANWMLDENQITTEEWRDMIAPLNTEIEVEKLTDEERIIFLSSMKREEKLYCELAAKMGFTYANTSGHELIRDCHEIVRKVKKILF